MDFKEQAANKIIGEIKGLKSIQTPAYVCDLAALRRNLSIAQEIKARTGAKIMLATKAFSQFSVFPYMKEVLDGTTASGLYEARLGHEHFGGEVHAYSPAFDEREIEALLPIITHLYFNSVSQMYRFLPRVKTARPGIKIGLRVNPQISLVKNSALYDPSAPNSRFGVKKADLTDEIMAQIDILHFHNLCENPVEDSEALIGHLTQNFGPYLERIAHVNLGGGHYFTAPGYDLERFVTALKCFKERFACELTLEPGGALVYDAGYLVTRVLDIFEADNENMAVLDTSASAHMPDVLEVPYRPSLRGGGIAGEKPHTYRLGGRTCMTGDVIGVYSFDEPLAIGDMLIFTDMAQYTMVKNTNFNGVPLPDIGILHESGRYEMVRKFGYEDFAGRLS
ncbi:MAG: carboxynorspermidine decarboxylase [Alphaproteobacteria bacterium]|nr:carboxynorspermidine decarboxylase [Alphaproteobacteria bacterium]